MPGADAVVCLVTAPPDRAREIATALAEKRLAACVNVVPESTRSTAGRARSPPTPSRC